LHTKNINQAKNKAQTIIDSCIIWSNQIDNYNNLYSNSTLDNKFSSLDGLNVCLDLGIYNSSLTETSDDKI